MAETGRRTTKIKITPEMIEAATRELVFDPELIRRDLAKRLIEVALEAGGYVVEGV